MNKTLIGTLFILAGLIYGLTAVDGIYNLTLGWLIKNGWVKEEILKKAADAKTELGRKATILLYSLGLIIIGTFILWNRNN